MNFPPFGGQELGTTGRPQLKLSRAEIAEGGMTPFPIVPTLDEVKLRGLSVQEGHQHDTLGHDHIDDDEYFDRSLREKG